MESFAERILEILFLLHFNFKKGDMMSNLFTLSNKFVSAL